MEAAEFSAVDLPLLVYAGIDVSVDRRLGVLFQLGIASLKDGFVSLPLAGQQGQDAEVGEQVQLVVDDREVPLHQPVAAVAGDLFDGEWKGHLPNPFLVCVVGLGCLCFCLR